MERTSGMAEVKIGLIDGPVFVQHADLAAEHIREIPGNNQAMCAQTNSTACIHGTFHRRDTSGKANFFRACDMPRLHALDPPHFYRSELWREHMPSTTPLALASAINEN
jgi:hypothetical protein